MDKIAESMFTDKEQEVVNSLFPSCPKISIDYAVMEKTDLAYVEPSDFGWSDLGTWGALYTITDHDEADNAVIGDDVTMIECNRCMVHVPKHKHLVVQGVNNLIIAEHNDTLLICQMTEEQRIKEWHN